MSNKSNIHKTTEAEDEQKLHIFHVSGQKGDLSSHCYIVQSKNEILHKATPYTSMIHGRSQRF